MTTATHTLGYTEVSRTVRTGLAILKVGAGVAIASAALGVATSSLGAPPTPAGHVIVAPAPEQHTVLGRGSLPALQLPA